MSSDRPIVATDTETTGLSFRHGCRPFAAVLTFADKTLWYEWDVDPFNRTPVIPPEDIEDLRQRFSGHQIWLFNAKFDLRAFATIGIRLWEIVGWENIHDVQLMAHAYQSDGNHGLKELCVRLVGILDDDERRLGQAVNRARTKARRRKWDIARPGHPHFPMVKRFGKNLPVWKADMWLPRAIAKADNLPPEDPWWTLLMDYGVLDGKRTFDLGHFLRERLYQENLYEQYEKNRRLLEVTFYMEEYGVPIRTDVVRKERLRFQKNKRLYAERALKAINRKDINLRSAQQLRRLLYEEYNLPVLETTKKGDSPSTEAEVLVRLLAYAPPEIQEFITNLILSKKFEKGIQSLESYALAQVNGRIHTNLKITGTDVNRFSSSDPNLQNVGKLAGGKEHWPDELREALQKAGVNLRRIFGPPEGYEWYAIDFAQMHPRIFAWLSGDIEAQQVFNEGKDYYVHLASGALSIPPEEVTPTQRALFKMVNLADLYGIGEAKLEKNTGMPRLKQLLAETFPSRRLFIGKIHDAALGKGYVTSQGGYRVYCADDHKLVNYKIISTEAEIAKQALYDGYRYLEKSSTPDYDPRIILTIHDEIVYQFPSRDRERNLRHVWKLAEIMEQAALDHDVVIPVEVTYIAEGLSWYDGKRIHKE